MKPTKVVHMWKRQNNFANFNLSWCKILKVELWDDDKEQWDLLKKSFWLEISNVELGDGDKRPRSQWQCTTNKLSKLPAHEWSSSFLFLSFDICICLCVFLYLCICVFVYFFICVLRNPQKPAAHEWSSPNLCKFKMDCNWWFTTDR